MSTMTALVRNGVAAALADSVLIAYAEEGSSTAALESLVHEWGMPVEHLG